MILAFSYRDTNGKYHEPENVTQVDGKPFVDGVEVIEQVEEDVEVSPERRQPR